MLKRYRAAAVGLCALFATVGLVKAAGLFSTLPIIGGPSFCGSTVSGTGNLGGLTGQGQGTLGSLCAQTIPAGPTALTGVENVEVDTNISGSAPPQTAAVPTSLLGGAVNRIIGGDFNINLWQRGTTPVNAQTPTSALMGADRWWVQTATSSGTQVTVSKQTGATGGVNDFIAAQGLNASMRVQRPNAQTGTGIVCTGHTLDSKAFGPLLGNNAVFSFFAQTGANWSPTSGNITVSVAAYTAADAASAQGAIGQGGTNTLTSALSAAGQASGITNYTAEVVAVSPGTTGSVASGVATIPIVASTAFTRYSVAATIPTTLTSSATAVTGGVVSICWTPVGTAGANDWIEFTGMQLESKPSTATNQLPNGVISPTAFERRYPSVEALYEQAYSWVVLENTSAANVRGPCSAVSTTQANCMLSFPTTMRQVPAVSYTAGFSVATSTAETALNACTALGTATVSGSTALTTNTLFSFCTAATVPAAGSADFLFDRGLASGAGVISVSAEP